MLALLNFLHAAAASAAAADGLAVFVVAVSNGQYFHVRSLHAN